MPENEIAVTQIAGDLAAANCESPEQTQKLLDLGFVEHKTRAGYQWVRKISDDDDRKKLVQAFIDMGALFWGGSGWSPAELVGFYRDEGFVKGIYRVIGKLSGDQYEITTVPEVERCPNCGTSLGRVGNFCGKCGAKI